MKASVCTLGCRVNQYESDAIAEGLRARGFTLVPYGEACDVVILNTCTVTGESDRKSRQLIRRIIEDARQIGYRCMLLDTLPVLEDAVRLYRQLGFYEIPCYNDSPVESTLFFQLDL